MPLKISQHDIIRLKDQAEKLKKRASGAIERSHEVVETLTRSAVVGSSAFAFGMIQGKTGGVEVVGVPHALGIGLGGHLAAMMGVGGNLSGQLHNLADGALAAYLTAMGRGVGLRWKATGSLTGATPAQGALPTGQGNPPGGNASTVQGANLSAQELAELAQQRR